MFLIDAVSSAQLIVKLKQFAEANGAIVRCERIKSRIRAVHEQTAQQHFFQPLRSERPLNEHLKNTLETSFEARKQERQDRP